MAGRRRNYTREMEGGEGESGRLGRIVDLRGKGVGKKSG